MRSALIFLFSIFFTCATPEAHAFSTAAHRGVVNLYKDTVSACVGRTKTGEPTMFRPVTVKLKRLQWSYDAWMDKVWGKPKSDGFFVDMKRSDAHQAFAALESCAHNGDPSANEKNNYNLDKIQAQAETIKLWGVTETKTIAGKVAAVNPKDPQCKAATDKHAAALNEFAENIQAHTQKLVEQCTDKVTGQTRQQ